MCELRYASLLSPCAHRCRQQTIKGMHGSPPRPATPPFAPPPAAMQRISTQLTGPLPVATHAAPPLPPRKATAEKKEHKDKADKKEKKEKKQKNRLRLSTSKLPAITAPAVPLSGEDEWLEAYLSRAMDVRQRLARFREDTRGLVGRASGCAPLTEDPALTRHKLPIRGAAL